jgi:phage FluMu protein Com
MVCKCHTVTFRPEICVKFIFKVDVQSDHLETKCSRVKVSQGQNVTVDVSSGSKCHSGRNVGGRNVKASVIVVIWRISREVVRGQITDHKPCIYMNSAHCIHTFRDGTMVPFSSML